MALDIDWGTGFEQGSLNLLTSSQMNGNIQMSGTCKTGDYALQIGYGNMGSNGVRWYTSSGITDFYMGAWLYVVYHTRTDDNYVRFTLDGGDYYQLSWADGFWNLRNASGILEYGTIEVAEGFHNLQVHIDISATGSVQVRVDGILDIDYSGDTTFGGSSSEMSNIYFWGGGSFTASYTIYLDDFCWGTGGWPGDLRFEALRPNADTATIEWTGSDGDQVDNYALVDEVPPDTDDYVESVDNGDQDKYELGDFDATNKNPIAAIMWAYVKKDEADDHRIKLILDDGTTEDIGAAQTTRSTYTYLHRIDMQAPSGFDWNDALLDALKAGVESVIV